jgi:peptidylprolyl isomerase
MKALALTIVACIALLLAGCGGDDDSATNGEATTESGEPAQSAKSEKPAVTVPEGPPPAKLEINDLVEGDGTEAKAGDEVSVYYVGVGYKSGKEFDASWGGEPLSFQLGAGLVIKGWDEGVEGMKEGGRRELVIPSDLAYGPEGSPPAIGPNEALIFVVELLAVESGAGGGETKSSAAGPKPEIEIPDGPPPTEVVVEDIEEGDGDAVKAGDTIVVEYVGVNYKTGKEFETTWGKPVKFKKDGGELIKGWEEGIEGMRVGGRRELIIPSELAFKTGDVIYVVELLEIE